MIHADGWYYWNNQSQQYRIDGPSWIDPFGNEYYITIPDYAKPCLVRELKINSDGLIQVLSRDFSDFNESIQSFIVLNSVHFEVL